MDLSELLPASLTLSLSYQHEQYAITLSQHGAPGSNTVQLVVMTRRPAPHTICDLRARMVEAFTVYLSVIAQHHPVWLPAPHPQRSPTVSDREHAQ